MRNWFLAALLAPAALAGGILYRTLTWPSAPTPSAQVAVEMAGAEAAAGRLAEAVRIRTVSTHPPGSADNRPADLIELLRRSFPRVFTTLAVETVSQHSLLLTWTGSEPGLSPIMLTAHMDVVPVAPGTEAQWTREPFGGVVEGGYVWGRGTLDDKGAVLGILEAAEALLVAGYVPRRTVLLGFGHDEEVGGADGAAKIAELMAGRGIRAEFLLDEGGVVAVDGVLSGVSRPVGVIGIAEKGYLSVHLEARAEPGHSSMPPEVSAVGRLAKAVARLEEHQFPYEIRPLLAAMLQALAPGMPFKGRMAIANLWAFKPLVIRDLAGTATGRASLRTSTAPTILAAGSKDNVLPGLASATINFRILPGDTIESVMAHITSVVDDPEVNATPAPGGHGPSGVSDPDGKGFNLAADLTRGVFKDSLAVPALTVAGTDAYHYQKVSGEQLRFIPVPFAPSDLARFHGTNERIRIEDHMRAITWYREFIRRGSAL